MPERPLDCRVDPFGSSRNDKLRGGSKHGLGTPPTMLSLQARQGMAIRTILSLRAR